MSNSAGPLSVWFSKISNAVIPFDRIICVDDYAHNNKQIVVLLEGDNEVLVDQSEIKSFKDNYETYIRVSELVSMGIDTDAPKRKS